MVIEAQETSLKKNSLIYCVPVHQCNKVLYGEHGPAIAFRNQLYHFSICPDGLSIVQGP